MNHGAIEELLGGSLVIEGQGCFTVAARYTEPLPDGPGFVCADCRKLMRTEPLPEGGEKLVPCECGSKQIWAMGGGGSGGSGREDESLHLF